MIEKERERGRVKATKYRRKNPEKYLEYMRAYRAKYPDKIKQYASKWYAANKSKAQNSQYKRSYGITIDDYERLSASQGNVCAVCLQSESHLSNSGKLKKLAVDHDHKTGKVRQLLCADCNMVLGVIRDEPWRLRALAEYLERHQSVGVQ